MAVRLTRWSSQASLVCVLKYLPHWLGSIALEICWSKSNNQFDTIYFFHFNKCDGFDILLRWYTCTVYSYFLHPVWVLCFFLLNSSMSELTLNFTDAYWKPHVVGHGCSTVHLALHFLDPTVWLLVQHNSLRIPANVFPLLRTMSVCDLSTLGLSSVLRCILCLQVQVIFVSPWLLYS